MLPSNEIKLQTNVKNKILPKSAIFTLLWESNIKFSGFKSLKQKSKTLPVRYIYLYIHFHYLLVEGRV